MQVMRGLAGNKVRERAGGGLTRAVKWLDLGYTVEAGWTRFAGELDRYH